MRTESKMAKVAVVGCGNGAIARLGRPLGVATPVNDTVVGIIKACKRGMLGQWGKGSKIKSPGRGRGVH